jgi:isopentenyldiphosphate isomerase
MGSGFDHLTESIQYTLQQAYDAKHPRLPKWWDEKFALESLDGEHVLDMDGCGVDLFGIITFGVFLIAYVRTDDGLKYWIQKRAMSKRVWPGKLDTVAAGSVKPQEKAFEAVVREAGEEAGFSQEYTRANIRSCGVLTFQLASTNAGDPGAQHHVQYIYEMEVQPDMIPYPVDGEVEEFKLISLEEVIDAVVKDEFKLNLVMVWVDYLIRHGIVTAENEKDFLEVSARLHRKFDLFVLDEPCSHL